MSLYSAIHYIEMGISSEGTLWDECRSIGWDIGAPRVIGRTNAPATTEYGVWIEERFNTWYGKERRKGERSLGTEAVDNEEIERSVCMMGTGSMVV